MLLLSSSTDKIIPLSFLFKISLQSHGFHRSFFLYIYAILLGSYLSLFSTATLCHCPPPPLKEAILSNF